MRSCIPSAILITVSWLAACTSSETLPVTEQSDSQIEYSYTRPGADFSKYRALMFVPLEILNADGTPMAQSDDLQYLRGEFRRAFIDAMDGAYMVLTRPSRDVLRVKAQLVASQYRPPGAAGTGLSFEELGAGGQLQFFMQLEDSYSDELLLQASDRSPLGAARTEQAMQESIAAAARYWAGLFKEFLDQNVQDARTR